MPGNSHDAHPVVRSRVVTAVAIVNFILGGLKMLCCVYFIPYFALSVELEFNKSMEQSGGQIEGAADTHRVFVLIVMIHGYRLILSILLVLAGIGVLRRRPWGRKLTIILGVITPIPYLILLVYGAFFGILPWLGVEFLIDLVIIGIYAIFVLIVLLNRRYAAEFRSASPSVGGV
jgi:hypothetical protein